MTQHNLPTSEKTNALVLRALDSAALDVTNFDDGSVAYFARLAVNANEARALYANEDALRVREHRFETVYNGRIADDVTFSIRYQYKKRVALVLIVDERVPANAEHTFA